MNHNKHAYLKGFVPYGIAAAVLSLCGGITAAFPPNVVADWDLQETMVTWFALAYSLGAAVAADYAPRNALSLGQGSCR